MCVRDAVGPRRPAPQAECGDSVTNDTFKILAASLHSAYSSDVSALVVDVLSLFVVIVQGLLWVLAKLRRACGCGGRDAAAGSGGGMDQAAQAAAFAARYGGGAPAPYVQQAGPVVHISAPPPQPVEIGMVAVAQPPPYGTYRAALVGDTYRTAPAPGTYQPQPPPAAAAGGGFSAAAGAGYGGVGYGGATGYQPGAPHPAQGGGGHNANQHV
jgi:hypothetical protein